MLVQAGGYLAVVIVYDETIREALATLTDVDYQRRV